MDGISLASLRGVVWESLNHTRLHRIVEAQNASVVPIWNKVRMTFTQNESRPGFSQRFGR